MTELQEKVLGLLEQIDELCRENDVTYYLTAGTLLGALRHKGFIPWDDDADIIMTRNNWKKFLERTRGKLPDGIVLNTQDDDPNLAMTANHYVDTNSAEIYRYDLSNSEQTGIMVDIIIMDPVPNGPDAKDEYITSLTNHTELTTLTYQYSLRMGKPTNFEHYWNESQSKGKRAVLDEIDGTAFSYDEETSAFYVQRFAGSPHFWPKEWYGEPKYVPFETTKLPIPQRAADCLCVGFDDDWMYVPAVGDLKSTHEFCVRSMSVPGKFITEDFGKMVDHESVVNDYVQRKKIWVGNTDKRFYQTMGRDPFATARLQMLYDRKRKEEGFESYLSQKDYASLERYFDEYISVQCTSRFLGSSSLTGWANWYRKCHPYLIDIGDEELYAVLILAFRGRHLTWVGRLIQARETLDRPMTERLLSLKQLYKAIKTANSYFSCGEWDKCRSVLDEYIPLWPDNPFLYTLSLQLKLKEGYSAVDVVREVEDGLRMFPEDAELLEILAEAYFETNRYRDALDIYQKLVETTAHGFVLMHMQERVEQLREDKPSDLELCGLWLKIRERRGETNLPQLEDLCPKILDEAAEEDSESASVEAEEENIELYAEMTDVQRKRYDLLGEVAEICDKNDIKYFLIGKALWMAVRTGRYTDTNADIQIAMDSENCDKFIHAVEAENNLDRYLDSMYSNPYFHRFAVRYCDRNSLDMTVSKCISSGSAKDYFGIYVTIEVLRSPSNNKFENLLQNMLEVGWEAYISGRWKYQRQHIGEVCVNVLSHVLGQKRTAKWIFQFLLKNPKKKNGGKVFIKPYENKQKNFPDYYFDFTKKVIFEGHEFKTMKMSSEYLKSQYGAKWKEKLPDTNIDPLARIVDANIRGKDFVEYLDKQGNIREDYWKNFRETERNYSPISTINKRIDYYWDTMCLCGERYRLYDKYMLMKSYIMELYNNDEIEILTDLMNDYVKTALSYATKEMDISFDKQISTVSDYVMFKSHRDARLVQRIRAKHKSPSINKDYVQLFRKLREAQTKDLDAILYYMKPKVEDCIYMYIDIKKYGLKNPNMKVWFSADKDGINLVVMKYHTSISVYTRAKKWDANAVVDIIQKEQPESITATKEIVGKLYVKLESRYNVEYGNVYEFTSYRPIEFDGDIELADEHDTSEIARLIKSDEKIGGYYVEDELASQLAERMRTGMGRSYVIRDQGKIVAHIASYAECDGIATTGGLIVNPAYQSGVYGTVLEGYLIDRLKEDNFRVYTFVTSRLRKLLLSSMGNVCVGEYGKMTLKTDSVQ